MGQPGFFDLDERYSRLSENGDPLVKRAHPAKAALFGCLSAFSFSVILSSIGAGDLTGILDRAD